MKIFRLVFAVMLLLCWFNFPYGYYQLIRFLGFVIFGILAFESYKSDSQKFFIYIGLCILFQPFFKIYLGRELWNIVDTAVAGFLIWESLKK